MFLTNKAIISCGKNNGIMKKGNSKLLIRNLRIMEENKQLNIGSVMTSCPFCGSEVDMKDMGSDRYHIKCKKCPCNFGDVWGNSESKEYLIEKWNKRA